MSLSTIPLNIFARERSRIPTEDANGRRTLYNIHYDIPIAPRIPLHIGLLVRVIALEASAPTPSDGNELNTAPAGRWEDQPPHYSATSTNIVGKVIGIRSLEKSITELVVKNEDSTTTTAYAYLAIHHAEGRTISLPLTMRILRAVLSPLLLATRDVPIEGNAVITADDSRKPPRSHRNRPTRAMPTVEQWMERDSN